MAIKVEKVGDPSRPESGNILGIRYSIEYTDTPSDVDIYKRASLWGQVDFWTRTIRVYDNGRSIEDRWHTIIHEVIHGISSALNIEALEENEDAVDMLALALVDTMFRNEWINRDIAGQKGERG